MNNFIVDEDIVESILEYLTKNGLCTNNIEYQRYTARHQQAFMAVEYILEGKIRTSSLLHDTDKLAVYGLIDAEETNKIHIELSRHHIANCKTTNDIIDCVIDYECARLTKPDKPLNAYNTIMKFRPNTYSKLKPALEKFGVDSGINVELNFEKWNQIKDRVFEEYYKYNIAAISRLFNRCNTMGISNAVREFYTIDFKDGEIVKVR